MLEEILGVTKKGKGKKPRGFAWLKIHDPTRLKEISAGGGKASQGKRKGHRWDKERAGRWAIEGGKARWRHRGAGKG